MPKLTYTTAERLKLFWAKVNKRGPITRPELGHCWVWIAGATINGYGAFGIGHQEEMLAHRFSWTIKNGPIPDGIYILHKCDHPPCVRPSHLFAGSQLDNLRDAASKGRIHTAKLTPEQVLVIRRATRPPMPAGMIKYLAQEFGVSFASIYFIRNGKTYKNLTI